MQRILIIEDDTTIRNGFSFIYRKRDLLSTVPIPLLLQIPCLQKWSII